MFHESRTCSQQVLQFDILIRVYINNVMLVYSELEGYSEITIEQLPFFQRAVRFTYKLMISFCSCANIEIFKNIYKNFGPEKDYDSRCFKIVNRPYLKYIEAKGVHYLKRKDFDVVFLKQTNKPR